MALLTPKTGSKIIAISLYMPQHNTTYGNKTYNEALQWLNKTLTKDLSHAAVILGGELQATPSARHPSHNPALALFCTSIGLRPLGDSCTPTFTPTSSPLDHWHLRLPTHIGDTTYDEAYTTPKNTTYSDHRALIANIPQVGNPSPQTKTQNNQHTYHQKPPSIHPTHSEASNRLLPTRRQRH